MILGALLALFVALILVLVRALKGPTLYDRVLAVNAFGTKTVLILASLGFLTGRPDFLDIAILYALVNFVSTIAILKFFRYRSFQGGLDRRGRGAAAKTRAGGTEGE
jgi:multicomponent Na+:H+ antiporter subunit F